jgi:hypothetical protein
MLWQCPIDEVKHQKRGKQLLCINCQEGIAKNCVQKAHCKHARALRRIITKSCLLEVLIELKFGVIVGLHWGSIADDVHLLSQGEEKKGIKKSEHKVYPSMILFYFYFYL